MMCTGEANYFRDYKRLGAIAKLATSYAITRGLFNRVLGADDPPFRAVMGKRGDAGAAAGPVATGVGSSSGATMVAASASETPSRWARAVRERAGASPRARSAASSAGRRT